LPVDTKPRRPGGRNADITRAIFAATTGLLVDGGFRAVTFQQVAALAGVGRATLYRRWPTTADLIGDAIRASAAELIVMPNLGSLRDDLRYLLREIADFIASPIGRAALTAGLSTASTDGAVARDAHWTARWFDVRPMFERAVDRAELAASVDAEVWFAMSAGAIYFRQIVMNQVVDQSWIDRIVEQLPIARSDPGQRNRSR
jgi:AcrR family transcriptional regulator